jgi:quercetin dioxygenase-like cupin family protein
MPYFPIGRRSAMIAENAPKILSAGEGLVRTVLGERYTWKLSGAESGSAYAMVESEVSPGAGPPLHRHTREDESFYVLAGSYEFRVGEQTMRLGVGGYVYGPRGIPHTYRNVGATVSRHLVVISPAGFEKFLEALSRLPPGPPDMATLTRLAAEYGLTFA